MSSAPGSANATISHLSVVDVEDTFHPARLEARIHYARRDGLTLQLADERLLRAVALPGPVPVPFAIEARPVVSLHECLRPQHVVNAGRPDGPGRRPRKAHNADDRRRLPAGRALGPSPKEVHR